MLCWIALCLSLLALQAHATGGALSNAATGVAGVYTGQQRISDHPHHVLMGHVIIVSRDGALARALVIGHRLDGIHRLRFSEAWTAGQPLPFHRETGAGCTHGHCRDGSVGMILLDGAGFDQALRRGLAARLTVPSGTIDISVPAALFHDAATHAAGM
ncbi:hypothetical protein [Roseicyclus mahoneyensis]|uniref:Uncharacterized protein n=1 Tax=Roseicyclus mahoneyensis TaxID=164332 RepID=A0A316GJX6_9RHOB|nr:hypothetical protein [Roseicyclus mahoneyensis]PWK61091.1 hypothetical protein C7455_103291 [Roseicyclus mahoneyensis]